MKTPEDDSGGSIDEVMAEVRRIKAELLARYNGDLSAMARDARARQGQSGHPVVTRVPQPETAVRSPA